MTSANRLPSAMRTAESHAARTAPIERALALPNGARFYRSALQINPYHYANTFRGTPSVGNEDTYIDAIMTKCVALGIEVIAVTDHNCVSSVDQFRRAGDQLGVRVFPGFELISSENVHVLCIYDRDVDQQVLERHLGAFGISDPNPSSSLACATFVEILQQVRDQGGVTIAAHVTQSNGLFTTLLGQACIRAWKDPNLLAIQIPGAVDDLPPPKKAILKNKDPEYRRDSMAAPDLACAVVNAADVKDVSDLDNPSASCWIKMSEVSVEGLRQAFLDPSSRIRLASDGEWGHHTEMVAMSWQGGGFLDNAAVHLNENLNVLIGGRGTGKSTVVESLRYVLGLVPIGDDAKRQHEAVIRNVLGSGTKISLKVRSHHPNRRDYVIERTIPNPSVVRDAQGQVLNLLPLDVVPRTEVYGQHEIAELTRSPEKLTKLLVRFVAGDPTVAQRRTALRRALEKSRSRIIEAKEELRQIEDRLAALPALEETLKQFQEAGIEDRLKEQSLVVREERVFKTTTDRIAPVRETLEEIKRRGTIDTAFLSEKALAAFPTKALLRQLDPILADLTRDLLAAGRTIESALQRTDTEVARIRALWDDRKRAAQTEFESILRDLQRSKVDGHEFIRLREEIEELRPLTDRRAVLQRIIQEYQDRRRTLTTEWEDVKRHEYQELEDAARRVSKQLAGRVRVKVAFGGDRTPLRSLLRDQVGGRLSQAIDALAADSALSLPELTTLLRGDAGALATRFKIPPSQAERLTQAPDDVVMQIDELYLMPTTSIELNVAGEQGDPEWHSLGDLSTGQKATAVLLLLLLESDAPLIVDQPEDDLDNRFITEGIVPKMREEKRRRQFIFTTHNANIPVLGDAELIIGLGTSAEDGQVRAVMPPEHMGSIDKRSVRLLVEELLEGGKDAFETRRRKYRF